MTFDEIWKKYFPQGNGCRGVLDVETERCLVNDIFLAYEEVGFTDIFISPFDLYPFQKEHEGQSFEVISRVEEGPKWDIESLPAWNIRFPDGFVMEAYPEEICKYERECKWNLETPFGESITLEENKGVYE